MGKSPGPEARPRRARGLAEHAGHSNRASFDCRLSKYPRILGSRETLPLLHQTQPTPQAGRGDLAH